MLHSFAPLALVATAVRVRVDTLAVLLVESVGALVLAPILPHIITEAVHHSILELTLEVAAIGPLEASETTHLII